MRLGIGSINVGQNGSVRKIKKARDVICHTFFDAQVIKNGWVDEELP